eukprot:TRINITY_DN6471_c0_g1_i1.p1 TRINITY_DN6471_c0_g1~~TRINITY_DN6471_c0_g1_i1.p1  ORF type:complete len:244 (+),score=39.64 TRINITY_DN6471_c0_g1_i1:3-734(+)
MTVSPITPNYSSFVSRIKACLSCDAELVIVALIYLERYYRKLKSVEIAHTEGNVLPILISTSVMLACKFWSDKPNYNNSFFASLSGVTTKEMNRFEIEFLLKIDFRLAVTSTHFISCSRLLFFNNDINHNNRQAIYKQPSTVLDDVVDDNDDNVEDVGDYFNLPPTSNTTTTTTTSIYPNYKFEHKKFLSTYFFSTSSPTTTTLSILSSISSTPTYSSKSSCSSSLFSCLPLITPSPTIKASL